MINIIALKITTRTFTVCDIKNISTVMLTLLFSTYSYAQTYEYNDFQPNQQYYLGVSIGHGIHNKDSFSEFKLTTVTARLGHNYTSNIGFEVRYATGLSEDEIGSLNRELDSLMGAYAVYTYPINKKFNLFGIAGITDLEIIQSQRYKQGDYYIKNEYSETGPSLGAGFEFVVNSRARWLLEGIVYVDGNDVDYGQISGGFRVSF